jgi:plastocyanin
MPTASKTAINKYLIALGVLSALIALFVLISLFTKPEELQKPPVFQRSSRVTITDEGFLPETIRVSKDEAVVFENTGSLPRWIASDPHPSHDNLPGFDSRKALLQGETYTFTFRETGVFTYHDHLNPFDFGGTVIVIEQE